MAKAMTEITDPVSRIRIGIRGAVQGVGFRPFVFRLAQSMQLTGWVCNSTSGVVVEAEGVRSLLDEFQLKIQSERPQLSSIHSLEVAFLDPSGSETFEIHNSDSVAAGSTLVLPDIATCADCIADVLDPGNRRYLYPFTNCTNCGPRFTIQDSIPWDRPNTTMARFPMCAACKAEYHDPLNRRFHAQPNACPHCGPHLELWAADGRVVASGHAALLRTVEYLKAGQIAAVKGMGGFHLMVDATNEAAVARLRERKHREEKPLAVMASSLEQARHLCVISPMEERVLQSPESPIVLLTGKNCELAPSVAPGNPYLGLMLPYTPLHHILMREVGIPLVATSGNRKDEPICIDEHAALKQLSDIADIFLVHDRPIRRHVDDSIVRILLQREQILRRARGYAPLPISVNGVTPPTLATGAQMKNAIAISIPANNGKSNVFVSPHIGDLETLEAYAAFERVIDDLKCMYQTRFESVACDGHPEYASTRYASKCAQAGGLALSPIQHHCAHVAACMAENEIEDRALGVAFDGSGWGDDGTVWGGEFIVANNGSFHRIGHLRTFPLPGGDAAARRPSLAALGLCFEIFGDAAFRESDPPMLRQMLLRHLHTPRTSSAGRLFDAVASIAGIRHAASFEGQAAMALEFAVDRRVQFSYPYRMISGGHGECTVVDWEPTIRKILSDRQARVNSGVIAAGFHNTLVEMIVDIAYRAGEMKVVLTGGCFQNRYLTERAVERLTACGFQPFWHQRVPPNDGGIALGQVMAAAAIRREENLCVSQFRAG